MDFGELIKKEIKKNIYRVKIHSTVKKKKNEPIILTLFNQVLHDHLMGFIFLHDYSHTVHNRNKKCSKFWTLQNNIITFA